MPPIKYEITEAFLASTERMARRAMAEDNEGDPVNPLPGKLLLFTPAGYLVAMVARIRALTEENAELRREIDDEHRKGF